MAIDSKSLKEFVKLAKDAGATELVYETKTIKLKVSFGATGTPLMMATPTASVPVASVTQPTTTTKATPVPPREVTPAHDIGLYVIKSPFVGTYYSSPAPGKPVYVKVGDKVQVGQTLCVLEAMKIMNEIDTDTAGEVVEICVENESLVEYGQALFKIKRS